MASDSTATPRFIDLKTAATILGICRSNVHKLIQTGELESVKLGARRLIPVDALDVFIDQLRSGGAS
ncbi:MAG: helix-turn-helix domain-containing protein [Acidimicrobiia bacterium]|nr:helix-turn-helix domain-containing protein [Acidimicrobiia bacterium]